MKSELFYFFKVLVTPSCWLQHSLYSREYDKKLRRLIATDKFEIVSEYVAIIGGISVWIANHPYASFETYCRRDSQRGVGIPKVRPSRRTIFKAFDKLVSDSLGEVGNGED